MLELLKEVDAEQVEKLKNYIEDKKADIVERDIVLHCLKQAKEHFKGKKDIYQQLGQCCEMLEDRFEFRQLTEEEEEKFRKGRNAREYYKKKIYVYPHRYLVIDEGNTSSRFYPSFSGPFANEESKCWSLGANEPKFYTVWENYRYVGRIEVASNKNIWKIYGSDKEKAYKIFERYVRQIGLIATEEKIGYLSEQERQEQEKTIYKQQQLGELRSIWYNPTAWLDSWQSATGDWKKEITKIILESYRSIDEEEMRCYRGKIMALHLVYTVLPNMLENEALYCKEHLEYLEYFLRKSIKIQYGIDCELLEALNVKSLLELYKPFFKIDTKEKAREFYEFNHSRQDILRYDRIETIPKALWENFQNFNS